MMQTYMVGLLVVFFQAKLTKIISFIQCIDL